MPRWKPKPIWEGLDAFIIGGGDSLRTFDWNLLKDEMTIGCNSAFSLGSEICKLCIFGDSRWFKIFQLELETYDGIVFTSVPQLQKSKLPWLWLLQRESVGLHHKSVGWNGNTGSTAINLALILGAKRVFLLGFDMKLSKDNRPNWHGKLIQKPNATVYPKFVEQFKRVQTDLEKKFPGREIINITDDNQLSMFPHIGAKKFWKERKLA